MAGIDQASAQARLDLYLAAEAAVLAGQSYRLATPGGSDRQVTKANLAEIQQGIEIWNRRVQQFSRGGIPVRRAGCQE
jgi:hypothetical protein